MYLGIAVHHFDFNNFNIFSMYACLQFQPKILRKNQQNKSKNY